MMAAHRGHDATLPDRDRRVLQTVADFRIVCANQLARLHFPESNHATALSATRLARYTLKRLTERGFLIRLERRVGGSRAGSASFCYALGDHGMAALDLPRNRRREPSLPFLGHVLDVAELGVRLQEEARRIPLIHVICMEPETGCWRTFQGSGSEIDIVKPDLVVVLGIGGQSNVGTSAADQSLAAGPDAEVEELHWFIEVDRGTEHRPAIQRKLQAYERYYRSGVEQTRHGVFPRVLWSVSAGVKTDTRAAQLREWIDRTSSVTQELFVVRSFEETINELKGGES